MMRLTAFNNLVPNTGVFGLKNTGEIEAIS